MPFKIGDMLITLLPRVDNLGVFLPDSARRRGTDGSTELTPPTGTALTPPPPQPTQPPTPPPFMPRLDTVEVRLTPPPPPTQPPTPTPFMPRLDTVAVRLTPPPPPTTGPQVFPPSIEAPSAHRPAPPPPTTGSAPTPTLFIPRIDVPSAESTARSTGDSLNGALVSPSRLVSTDADASPPIGVLQPPTPGNPAAFDATDLRAILQLALMQLGGPVSEEELRARSVADLDAMEDRLTRALEEVRATRARFGLAAVR